MTSTDDLETAVSPGTPLQAVSNAMAQIYKRHFGRGPTRIRTSFAGPDTIVCILEDTQTPAERRLVDLGEHQRLRDVRLFFQYASVDEIKRPIEMATGRRVRAFISGVDTRADVCAEIFVLGDDDVVDDEGPMVDPSPLQDGLGPT